MSWYDKLKDEKILVHQGAEHNKFWAGKLHESTCSVEARWGRIGTKGQSNTKSFSTVYAAANHLDNKFREKKRKGYTDKLDGEPIDSAKLEELAIRAAVVGTQNKCHDMQWVEITSDGPTVEFQSISDQRLYEPDCVPGLLVAMETRKEYDGETSFSILFTGDAAHKARTNKAKSGVTTGKIEKSDELYELTKKVEEAVGRSLS
jgi:predicted DNA-binding WGR domain protein